MALYFDGSSSYATIPNTVLAGQKVFTIELIISTTETRSSGLYASPMILGFDIGGGGTCDFGIKIGGGNLYALSGLNGDNTIEPGVSIADGKVHKIALVSDGSSWILYLDGTAYNKASMIVNNIADHYIYIGHDEANSGCWCNMMLYELKIWNTAKTKAALFTTPNASDGTLLLWYNYRNKTETGTSLIDSSSKKNNATITGSLISAVSNLDSDTNITQIGSIYFNGNYHSGIYFNGLYHNAVYKGPDLIWQTRN